jgi:hypothetical protein
MKIGVCIRIKDEQNIICDWVRYYLHIGFDKLIIYDNKSYPSVEETLTDSNLYDKNHIEIIIDKFEGHGQPIVYQEAIEHNKELDWLLLCDTDEFIYIKNGNIKEFLKTFSSDTCTILINWVVFGSNKLQCFDTTKTIFEQFTAREDYSHFWNRFPKSLIRPNLIEKFGNVHITVNFNCKIRNVYNEEIYCHNYPDHCEAIDYKLNETTPVVIIHYMTLDLKSMLKKRERNVKYGLGVSINNPKYTIPWYFGNSIQCFKDNNQDLRMTQYINI